MRALAAKGWAWLWGEYGGLWAGMLVVWLGPMAGRRMGQGAPALDADEALRAEHAAAWLRAHHTEPVVVDCEARACRVSYVDRLGVIHSVALVCSGREGGGCRLDE